MIKIWDARTGKCDRTITQMHTGPITCIALSDSKLATGGDDGAVKILCFEAEEEIESIPCTS